MLSEICRTQKDKHWTISHVESKKAKTGEAESKTVVARAGGGGHGRCRSRVLSSR